MIRIKFSNLEYRKDNKDKVAYSAFLIRKNKAFWLYDSTESYSTLMYEDPELLSNHGHTPNLIVIIGTGQALMWDNKIGAWRMSSELSY